MESKTILLVDDQVDFLDIHRTYLEHHGYRVLVAVDGEEGVRSARAHHPDLILMDFTIPGLDGLGATEALKRDAATRDIPVVLVTAHAYGSVGRRARQAGCDAYVAKPCDPSRVLNEVRHWVGPS